MDLSRIHRAVFTRVYRDKVRFDELQPIEYRALEDLVGDPGPGVRLAGGDFHRFRAEDVERLWNDIPWYLRPFVKLPWVLVYRREAGGVQVYEVAGPPGAWTGRVLNYIIHGSLGGVVERLRYSGGGVLLERSPSLVILGIRANL